MIPCMRMGQVAGVAAALAVNKNVSPKELKFQDIKLKLTEQKFFT